MAWLAERDSVMRMHRNDKVFLKTTLLSMQTDAKLMQKQLFREGQEIGLGNPVRHRPAQLSEGTRTASALNIVTKAYCIRGCRYPA